MPVENITHELQQQRAEKLGRSTATSEISPSEFSNGAKSVPETTQDATQDEESKSQGEQSQSTSQAAESFIHTSQMGQSTFAEAPKPSKTKTQLWNELKIQSITRTFTMIYTLALLTLLTRIQLNLLGRRSYLSSVVSLAAPPPQESTISLENHDDDRAENSYGSDFETNRKFLTFSWWILNRGWKDIRTKVEAAVNEVFTELSVREDIPFERLSQLVIEIRKRIEGATTEERRSKKWLSYLLPPADQETLVLNESGVLSPPASSSVALGSADQVSPAPLQVSSISPNDPLRRLLDETSDLIDSPTASHITTLLLDALFSHLTDQALRTQAYKLPPLPSFNPSQPESFIDPTQRVVEVTDPNPLALGSDFSTARAKLATILATATRQAHAIGSGVPNEYVQAMEGVKELEAFAAVVYSSNFEVEGIRIETERREEETEKADAAEVPSARNPQRARSTWNPLNIVSGTMGWVFGSRDW